MAPPDILPTVYYFPGSFYSQKVLLALEEKGVPYQKKFVNLADVEMYAPWFMKLNPNGQVPFLQHGNTSLSDSKAITEYIDKAFDGPKLFPLESSPKYMKAQDLISLIDSLCIQALTYGTVAFTPDLVTDSQIPWLYRKKLASAINDNLHLTRLEYYKSQCGDDPALQAAYQSKIDSHVFSRSNGFSRALVEKSIEEADQVFDKIEKHLEVVTNGGTKNVWLLDESFGAADIALAVALQRLTYVGLSKRLWSKRPIVTKYRQRLLTEKPHYVSICINWSMKGYLVQKTAVSVLKGLPFVVGLSALAVGMWYYVKRSK